MIQTNHRDWLSILSIFHHNSYLIWTALKFFWGCEILYSMEYFHLTLIEYHWTLPCLYFYVLSFSFIRQENYLWSLNHLLHIFYAILCYFYLHFGVLVFLDVYLFDFVFLSFCLYFIKSNKELSMSYYLRININLFTISLFFSANWSGNRRLFLSKHLCIALIDDFLLFFKLLFIDSWYFLWFRTVYLIFTNHLIQ